MLEGYFVYQRTIWDSRTHCRRDCRFVAMVEGEYIAQYLCPNGHLYGVITSDVEINIYVN